MLPQRGGALTKIKAETSVWHNPVIRDEKEKFWMVNMDAGDAIKLLCRGRLKLTSVLSAETN